MITKHDHVHRQTCADTTISDVIRQALADNFEYSTYAGDPKLPVLITTILKHHFGFKDNSHLVAHTYCEVDYFRKEPEDMLPKPIGS